MKKELAVLSTLLMTSCVAPLTPHNLSVKFASDKPLEQRLDESERLVEKRKRQAYDYTLGEKAAIFNAERKFFALPEPFEEMEEDELKSDGRIKGSFAYLSKILSVSSLEYLANTNEKSRERALEILNRFIESDKNFGKPGQLPRNVIFSKKERDEFNGNFRESYLQERTDSDYIYLRDDAHGNTFPVHFLGLYFANEAFKDDEEMHWKIGELASRHIDYLLDEGFVVKRLNGEPTTHGGLTGKEYLGFGKTRLLSKVAILESAKYILRNSEHSETLKRIEEELLNLGESGFKKISNIDPKIANISLSSYSTNKKTFTDAFLLASTGKERYKEMFENYWNDMMELNNPLVTFLYLSLKPEEDWSFQNRKILVVSLEYLKSYPLDRGNEEVLNSFFKDEDINIDRFPTITKKGLIPRNETPLPIYRRGVDSSDWGKNPYRLNNNIDNFGKKYYNPLDFLLVYNLGLANGFIPFEERQVDKEKVEEYLKQIKPEFEKRMFK